MGRKYYLFKRKTGVFHAAILDRQGKTVATLSTGCRKERDAAMTVAGWLHGGLPARKKGRPPSGGAEGTRSAAAAEGLAGILRAVEKAADLDAGGALEIAKALRGRGLLEFNPVKTGKGNADLPRFLETFWDYEKSPYIRERLDHGYSMGRRHAAEMLGRVKLYWTPYFQGRTLAGVTEEDIDGFCSFLARPKEAVKPEGRGGKTGNLLAPASISKIMTAGQTAFRWACHKRMIAANPCVGLLRYQGKPKKRGILSMGEANAVLKHTAWNDRRACVGNLLASTTGMRAGEVLAFRLSDITPDRKWVHVRHSWSPYDGLKDTKTKEDRLVPLLPEVLAGLESLAGENPFGPEGFVFYSAHENQPMDEKFLIGGLRDSCERAGIDWKGRNICFHSWRHFFSTYEKTKMTAQKAMLLTGHKSAGVFESYSGHTVDSEMTELYDTTQEVFAGLFGGREAAE
jgi:integrase